MPKQIAEMVISETVMELPDTKTIRLKWPEEKEKKGWYEKNN